MKNLKYIILSVLIVIFSIGTFFTVKNFLSIFSNNDPQGREYRDMDGQYSFGVDICSEVSKEWMQEKSGITIIETESPSDSNSTSCHYITNKERNEFIAITVAYLNINIQLKGQQYLGRDTVTIEELTMPHFIAIEENDAINAIYLSMTDGKYVRLDRTKNTITNGTLINIAIDLQDIILYKQ